jgi:hypothetical protein
MATPAPTPRYVVTFSRVLILADCILAAVLAVLLLLTDTSLDVLTALGWVFVVLGIYLASLLVP